jgi:DNA primase
MTDILDVVRDIEHSLLSRGSHLSLVFGDVDGQRGDRGHYTSGKCPFCGEAGKLSISNEKAVSRCWRASCQWGDKWRNWHEYAQARGRAGSWIDFYQDLAPHAGIEWPQPDPQSQQRYEAKKQREALLETAAQTMRDALQAPSGASVLAYLRGERGYSDKTIEDMGLLAYLGQQELLQALKARGHDEQAIRAADLISPKWEEHPVMMLWRDRAGQPIGFMGRAISSSVSPKYLYSKGLPKREALPGLERARGAQELILMESPLGAAYLNAQGLGWPVVALGGAGLSKPQQEALQQAGVKRLILALDADAAGQKATEETLKALLELQDIERIMIATWKEAEGKGLDDLALGRGLPAAQEAVKRAERVGSWLARRLAQTLPQQPEALEEEALLDRAVEQYLWLSRRDLLQARAYVEALSQALSQAPELLWPRMDKAERRLRDRESRQQTEALLQQAGLSLGKGDRDAALETLQRAAAVLQQGRPAALPQGYLWSQVEQAITQEPEALKTGYPSLDGILSLPRAGLSVIAAPSGQGKTTLMLNLLHNWSGLYPDEALYFYSYEEPAPHIALKLIVLKAGTELNKAQNYQAYVSYLRHYRPQRSLYPGMTPAQRDTIEEAIQWYEGLASSGRLILDYSMPPIEALADTLSLLGKRGGVGAVVVDYIQRVPSGRTFQNRQLELAGTVQKIGASAKPYGLAIITGSQLNEDERVREARDIYHEAEVVLKLKRQDGGATGIPELLVSIEKQRAGASGREVSLCFDGPNLKVSDKQQPSSGPAQQRKGQPAQGKMSI